MGYKKMDRNFGFADLALESSLKHNRSLKIHPVKYIFQISAYGIIGNLL